MKTEIIRELEVHSKGDSEQAVLVLGNAYGVMPYQAPLVECLAENGFAPYWFAFRGQDGVPGKFTGRSGIEDIGNVLAHLKERYNRPADAIAHCASAGMLLIHLSQSRTTTNRVIAYGLLFRPSRRRKKAEPQLRKSNVDADISDEMWQYDVLGYARKVQSRVLFCHARDKINLERGTEREMQTLIDSNDRFQLRWFEKGYDRHAKYLSNFLPTYLSWLKTGE